MAKTMTIRIDEELHMAFKIYATKRSTDMTQLLIEYIHKALEEEKADEKKEDE